MGKIGHILFEGGHVHPFKVIFIHSFCDSTVSRIWYVLTTFSSHLPSSPSHLLYSVSSFPHRILTLGFVLWSIWSNLGHLCLCIGTTHSSLLGFLSPPMAHSSVGSSSPSHLEPLLPPPPAFIPDLKDIVLGRFSIGILSCCEFLIAKTVFCPKDACSSPAPFIYTLASAVWHALQAVNFVAFMLYI